jgi:hypothetical protein
MIYMCVSVSVCVSRDARYISRPAQMRDDGQVRNNTGKRIARQAKVHLGGVGKRLGNLTHDESQEGSPCFLNRRILPTKFLCSRRGLDNGRGPWLDRIFLDSAPNEASFGDLRPGRVAWCLPQSLAAMLCAPDPSSLTLLSMSLGDNHVISEMGRIFEQGAELEMEQSRRAGARRRIMQPTNYA